MFAAFLRCCGPVRSREWRERGREVDETLRERQRSWREVRGRVSNRNREEERRLERKTRGKREVER